MKNIDNYSSKVKAVLSPAERRVFEKLKTPEKVQDFLDHLPANFEYDGEVVIFSPRQVLKEKRAHCIEGALLAATALAYHGRVPWLLDLQTPSHDEDHVVALFKENNLWGAISKTNHPVLRYRDPVYKSVRELAMSYFHEYFYPETGSHYRKKSLRAFSKPFDLRRYKPESWITTEEDLDWLAVDLDDSPHSPTTPPAVIKKLRKASKLEIKYYKLSEWKEK